MPSIRTARLALPCLLLLSCSRHPSTASHIADAAPSASLAVPASAAPSPTTPDDLLERPRDAEYVPTPQVVIDKMLEVAQVGPTDVVYDLGCGDGRILVEAARQKGASARGFEIDPALVSLARDNAAKAGVSHLVHVEQADLFQVDLSKATVLALYLMPWMMLKLLPRMQRLPKGARVVSHDFDLGGIRPAGIWTVEAPDHRDAWRPRPHFVYLWRAPIPLQVE